MEDGGMARTEPFFYWFQIEYTKIQQKTAKIPKLK